MTTTEGDRRPPVWTWDELVLACDLVARNNWRSLTAIDQRVQELSKLLQALPTYPRESRGSKFRNSNGVARKTVDLATHHPDFQGASTNGGRLDLDVINAFIENPKDLADTASALRQTVNKAATIAKQPPYPDLGDDTAAEGRLLERLHLIRERDPKIRARKIADAREQLGHVGCEVCVSNSNRSTATVAVTISSAITGRRSVTRGRPRQRWPILRCCARTVTA